MCNRHFRELRRAGGVLSQVIQRLAQRGVRLSELFRDEDARRVVAAWTGGLGGLQEPAGGAAAGAPAEDKASPGRPNHGRGGAKA